MSTAKPSELWKPVLVALILHLCCFASYVYRTGGDVSVLLCVGSSRKDTPEYREVQSFTGKYGYDGQFYYALAQSPLSKQSKFSIDVPGGRQTRILYPLTCWVLSGGGNPQLLLWVMPAVNLLAITGIALFGCAVARRYGANPWWGLILPIATGASMAGLRDLTDPLSTLTLCGLIWTWIARSSWWVVLLASLAVVFAREQNLGIVLIVAMMHFWHRHWRSCAAALLACVAFGGWNVILRGMYDKDAFMAVAGNFDLPLQGWIKAWRLIVEKFEATPFIEFYFLSSLCYVAFLILFGAWLTLTRPVDFVARWIALAGVMLGIIAGVAIFEDVWGYARVLVWLPLGIWLLCIQNQRSRMLWVLVPTLLWFARYIIKPEV